MPKENIPSLNLEIKPSYRLRQMVLSVHFVAVCACLANSLAIPIKLFLCAIIGLQLWLILKRLTDQHYRIRLSKLGWEMAKPDDFQPIRILDSTLITFFLTILHIESHNNKKLTILVVNDALGENDYRQLVVGLKTSKKMTNKYGGRI